MMNNDMIGLLNLAYEIEGLLLLHINRGDEAAPEMKDLLVSKAERLLAGLNGDKVSGDEVSLDIVPDKRTAVEPKIPAMAVEEKEISDVQSEDVLNETEVQSEPVAMTAADEAEISASVQFEEEADADTDTADESTAKPALTAEQPALTLDEKLARERAADISKAFTLNDRFRLCRELFRNSNEEFKETLEVIGSMADMEEAEEYFYNDLCWDPDKEEVKEFMAIVAKHF